MRITQGTFSFLPDLTDEELEAQMRYGLRNGWAIMIEHTDDPHPRNFLWEMWDTPWFDLEEDDVEEAMDGVRQAREALPERYIKVQFYDASLGRQSSRLSIIVQRPSDEPGFRLERRETHDRTIDYQIHPYAHDAPAGRRYGQTESRNGGGPDGSPL